MNFLKIFIFTLIVLFVACKQQNQATTEKPFANCKCGSPEPIFKEGGEAFIEDRNFMMSKDAAIENIFFKDSTTLQIEQKGCNEIVQAFSFAYKDKSALNATDEFWKAKAVEEFIKIQKIGDRYAPFGLWARAIQAASPQIRLGQPTELEKDFFVTIEKINNGNQIIMTVTLNAKSC
jgi:hypothetical protein